MTTERMLDDDGNTIRCDCCSAVLRYDRPVVHYPDMTEAGYVARRACPKCSSLVKRTVAALRKST